VPEALGLTWREWSDRIGLKVRDRAERINIETELAAEGLSNRAIADVLGVNPETVNRDMRAANAALADVEQEGSADDGAARGDRRRRGPGPSRPCAVLFARASMMCASMFTHFSILPFPIAQYLRFRLCA
jgi:Helix-turn-helix domain